MSSIRVQLPLVCRAECPQEVVLGLGSGPGQVLDDGAAGQGQHPPAPVGSMDRTDQQTTLGEAVDDRDGVAWVDAGPALDGQIPGTVLPGQP